MRHTSYIENFLRDLRYASRMLGANPAFTVVIVLTLALSIGANSAIFSVIDGVLLRPLPYADGNQIARVFLHSSTLREISAESVRFPRFPRSPRFFRSFAGYHARRFAAFRRGTAGTVFGLPDHGRFLPRVGPAPGARPRIQPPR